MIDNEMHLSFPAMSENEALARMCTAAFAATLNPTIEEVSDIRTAVSEAVTNAIVHGYNSKPNPVKIDAYIEGMTLRIVISDNGCGIADVDTAMQPFYTTAPNEERSGMGFAVMQAFMDNVCVESTVGSGTTVTLLKQIERQDGDE